MKKIYSLLFMSIAGLTFAQTPIITGIMDGDCPGGHPKALEIYASGTVNFADYTLQNQTNANTTWSTDLNLAALGTRTDTFVYVVFGDPQTVSSVFAAEFAAIPSANVLVYGTSPATMNVNGDDRVRIIHTETSTVIDQFGVESVDGTGEPWEYTDSWAKRNNGTGPDGSNFTLANWTFGGGDYTNSSIGGSLNNLGTCQQAAPFSTVVPFGQYSLSVAQNDIKGLTLFPNPVADGQLFINTANNGKKDVLVYDVLGKQVVKTSVTEQAVNVSALKNGVYIVKITENGKTATRKLIVK